LTQPDTTQTETLPAIAVDSVAAIQEVVRGGQRLAPRGGGTKTALSTQAPLATILDVGGLTGILEYEPGEFTFTARAGTTLREIQAALAEHGQYLPFDPPLVGAGATLGGTVAAGVNGSGRQRYGGVRDFLIGVRFVDGQGRLVRGGGKVVKNAAGFDLPKLMVGSLGRLGILVEVSFKVFPQPPAYHTLHVEPDALDAALDAIARLTSAPFDVDALDLTFDEAGRPHLYVRQGGLPAVLPERAEHLRRWFGAGELLPETDEASFWHAAREFAWAPAGWSLAKVPVTLADVPALDPALAAARARRRYASAGNLLWLAWPGDDAVVTAPLAARHLTGLRVLGPPGAPYIGAPPAVTLYERVKQTLDPVGKFL
jgi:glycolate oxidase FAD binding subunit